VLLACTLPAVALAAPAPLTLEAAVARAQAANPAVATQAQREAVAAARVDVARAEPWVRVNLAAQVDRSTGNVVAGATFPVAGLPGVQGPPGSTAFNGGAWQTVLGVGASWDAMELLRRPTLVTVAELQGAAARAGRAATLLEVGGRAADAFLVAVQARALVRAAEASEARTRTFHGVVSTLVGQALRPEQDLARAATDLAAARILSERTRAGAALAAVRLGAAIGEGGTAPEVTEGPPGEPPEPAEAPGKHPALLASEADVAAASARADAVKLGVLPRVELLGALFLRGGGLAPGAPGDGLLPSVPNWAVGVAATWAPTELPAVASRARAAAAEAAVQQAQGAALAQALAADVAAATASLASARLVAREAHGVVVEARRALALASARYTAALGNVVEVVDAERALAAAERDDAVARLDAWRAFVALCLARGDLGPLGAHQPPAGP